MNFDVGPQISNDPFFFDYQRLAGFRTFDRKFERSAGNSNVRPEIRTFDQKFERSAGNSNVRPEIRTFDRNLERSGGFYMMFITFFSKNIKK